MSWATQPTAVEVHKANAMRKLDMRARIEIARFARLQGWLDEP